MIVQVYWNLRKKCFSVRDKKTRRVIAHRQGVGLRGVTFKVSEAGRQRVLREKRKNVHAFLEGEWIEEMSSDEQRDIAFLTIMARKGALRRQPPFPVRYDPYENETFVRQADGSAIEECDISEMVTYKEKPIILCYEFNKDYFSV